MTPNSPLPEPPDLQEAAAAYAAGDDVAGENLCKVLAQPLRVAASRFLGDDSPEVDDVVQESLLAVLQYIRKGAGFSGDLVRFGVTVARNRCRNLLNWRARRPGVPLESLEGWLANTELSPLDLLLEEEMWHLLQETLDRLGSDCQELLRAFYLEEKSIDEIRRRVGLSTVQGVYYRRARCLEQAAQLLKSRLAECSSKGAPAGGQRQSRVEGTDGP